MQLGKPQVHLKKENATGLFHIHVVTWMDQTRFTNDGNETLVTTATGGVFTVVLKIREDSGRPDMKLLTPIVHTLTLTGISLNTGDPFLEVHVVNSTDSSDVGKTKTHQSDADDSSMPPPTMKERSK